MKSINCTITPLDINATHAHILLEGELTLGNIKEVVQQVAEAVDRYDHVKVEVKNVVNIDLTGIQLLYSIKKTASELHKQFLFDIHLPDETKIIIDHSGFGNLTALMSSAN